MREPSAIEAPASAAPPASVAASVVGTGAAAVGEGETNKVAVLVVVVVLLIAGIVAGLVIYGALGSQETDDGGDDKTKAPSKGNDARTSKMPPGTKSTRKAGLFVCVVGLHLSSRDPLETGFCDYIIYPELTLLHNKVVSTYGGTSWNIFKAAIKGFRSGTKAGGSFLESHPENYLSEELTAVENVVEPPLKFRALGFLDIKFAANALDPLKERLQVFNRILKTKPDGMTFLGVVVPSYSLGRVLAKELKDITYVNTIILQTHITPSTEDITHGACTVNYVAYRLGKKASAVPSFSIANKTWIEIKKQGHKFRVMFSLTFGVMIYTSTDEIKEYNDLCEDAFLGTVDALCPETGQNIVLKDDKEELAKYATWESNRTHHFLTTMDGNDIKAVLAEFIEDVSNGWAGFNIELDERKACNVDKKFALLKMIATAARTRKKP